MTDPDLSTLCGTFEIDPARSRVGFVARQLVGPAVRGTLESCAGGGRLDPGGPPLSTAEITIAAAGLQTGNARRDRHLAGAAFFDVAQHPHITFRATLIEPSNRSGLRVTGDLTVKGVTEEIAIVITCTEAEPKSHGRTRARFLGRGSLSRRAWGLGWGGFLIRDAVTVELDVSVVMTDVSVVVTDPAARGMATTDRGGI